MTACPAPDTDTDTDTDTAITPVGTGSLGPDTDTDTGTGMGDNLPGYTCPAIDRCKRALRRLRDGGEVDPVEIDSCLRELEQLREDNDRLRKGYARAAAPCGNKCRRR